MKEKKKGKQGVKHDWDVIMPEAIKLQDEGMEMLEMAIELGITISSLRNHLNTKTDRIRRRKILNAELRALKAKIPKDTRTPGQILLGEPVWERSALYKIQQEGSE